MINISLSFPGAIFIVFLVLKLTNTLTWSWFWILSPLWIPILIFLIILFIVYVASV